MTRFCIFDDKPVKAVATSDKEWGRGTTEEGFIHDGTDGIPNCGRRLLREDETYTEGESDLNPPHDAGL